MESEYSATCEASIISSLRLSPGDRDKVQAIELHIDEPAFRFREGQPMGVLVESACPCNSRPLHRYYSIANAWQDTPDGAVVIQLIVRCCFYNDEFSSEQYPGIASNHLCDRQPGDSVTTTGPYKSIFSIPRVKTSKRGLPRFAPSLDQGKIPDRTAPEQTDLQLTA
jgi:ferredoxin--NADP+ reductase